MQLKRMRITVEGKSYDVTVEMLDDAVGQVRPTSPVVSTPAVAPSAAPAPSASSGDGSILCPLAGVVAAIHVELGQRVAPGDLLVTLEAMKMNTAIRSPRAGTVGQIFTQLGAAVEEGAGLMLIA